MKLSLKCQVWIAKAALSCWLCTYSKGKRFIGGNKKSRENSPSNRCRTLQCHDMIGQYRTPCGNQSHLSRNGRTMSNIDFRFYSKSHAPKARWLKSPTLWALTASAGACSSPQMTVTISVQTQRRRCRGECRDNITFCTSCTSRYILVICKILSTVCYCKIYGKTA